MVKETRSSTQCWKTGERRLINCEGFRKQRTYSKMPPPGLGLVTQQDSGCTDSPLTARPLGSAHYFFKICFAIMLNFIPTHSKWFLFFRLPHQYSVYVFLLSHTCYTTHPHHSSLFCHRKNTWWWEQTRKTLAIQTSPAVFPLIWQTTFHIHMKQQAQLYSCIF